MLVTRPQPEAARTAARLIALGHEVMVAPLLTTTAREWQLPDELPQAVAFTSATAVRLAGAQLASLRQLPVFAVGAATAAAIREAGFRKFVAEPPMLGAVAAAGTAAALFGQVSASRFVRVLYLAGRDRSVRELPSEIELREVYTADLVTGLPGPALTALRTGAIDVTLLYSVRTAAHFSGLVDTNRLDRSSLHVAALSPAVLAAAGPGWASMTVSPEPAETALLTAAGLG